MAADGDDFIGRVAVEGQGEMKPDSQAGFSAHEAAHSFG